MWQLAHRGEKFAFENDSDKIPTLYNAEDADARKKLTCMKKLHMISFFKASSPSKKKRNYMCHRQSGIDGKGSFSFFRDLWTSLKRSCNLSNGALSIDFPPYDVLLLATQSAAPDFDMWPKNQNGYTSISCLDLNKKFNKLGKGYVIMTHLELLLMFTLVDLPETIGRCSARLYIKAK